jgi:hypothetical protein
MPDIQVQIQNKKHQLKGMNEKNTYSVIGADTNTVAISVSSANNVSHIVIYHFQDDDTMWVYPDDAIVGLATLNIREYFRRVRK